MKPYMIYWRRMNGRRYIFPLAGLLLSFIVLGRGDGPSATPVGVGPPGTTKSPVPYWVIMMEEKPVPPPAGELLKEEDLVFQVRSIEDVHALAFSPDSQKLAAARSDRSVRVFDLRKKRLLCSFGRESNCLEPLHIAFSPNGRILAFATNNNYKIGAPGELRLYDSTTGKLLVSMNGHRGSVCGLAFSADGKLVFTAAHDNTVRAWDWQTAKTIFRLRGATDLRSNLVLHPDGRTLACGGVTGVTLWDLPTRKARRFAGPRAVLSALQFSSDGKHLALGIFYPGVSGLTELGTGRTLRPGAAPRAEIEIWDFHQPRKLATLRATMQRVCAVAFSRDGKYLVSTDDWHSIRLWDARTGASLGIIPGSGDEVCFAFSLDGRFLATSDQQPPEDYRDMVKLWKTSDLPLFAPPPSPKRKDQRQQPREVLR